MRRTTLLLASALALVLPAGVAGQDARLLNDVDTTVVTVGDQVRLSVTVDHAIGSTVVWPDSLDLGSFEVLGAQAIAPRTDGDRVQSSADFVIAAFELGELEVPSFDVRVEGPGDATQTLSTDRFGIEVVSVGADEGGDIRDIRGPLGIPVSVVTVSLWAIILLLAGALAFWVVQRILRPRDEGPVQAPAAPPRPADEVALEALARISASPMLERGEVKEYHIAVSEVLRTFVEARFSVFALEMTTREVLYGLERAGVDSEYRRDLRRFLDECDMVKFAKLRPSLDASRSVLELGGELVRRAGPVPEPEPELEEVPEDAPKPTDPPPGTSEWATGGSEERAEEAAGTPQVAAPGSTSTPAPDSSEGTGAVGDGLSGHEPEEVAG